MKTKLMTLATAAAVIALTSCASRQSMDPNAPTGPPSASITLSGTSAAYWASAQGGNGMLYFNGNEYPFSAAALGAGGAGVQRISAEGKVYNLNSLSDFPGTYTLISTGVTILKGKKHVKLTNSKGVVIYAENKTMGVGTSTGGAKVKIELK